MTWRCRVLLFFFFNDTATTEIYTLSLHDALPISQRSAIHVGNEQRVASASRGSRGGRGSRSRAPRRANRSEEHTSELQSRSDLVCRLLLEKKKKKHARAVPDSPCRPDCSSQTPLH